MIDKQEVFEFLDKLRNSGATNMFGAGVYVQRKFRLSNKQSKDLLVEWMETYSDRHSEEN